MFMFVSQVSVPMPAVYMYYICVIMQWFAQADVYVISSGSVADYCMPGSTLNFVCAAEPIKVPKV